MWFDIQYKNGLEYQVRELKGQVERLQESLELAESRSFFYRSQVRLEASMGMALSRIAG